VDEVLILPYDRRWPTLYEAEATRLALALPSGLVLSIDHIGSTAIPGMPAKPVIDILLLVTSAALARATAVGPLEALGYAYWADNPHPDRLFFVKGLPPAAPHRTHHVHMREPGEDHRGRLLFRDHLRANPDEAARYAALKYELAARHGADREAYTDAKSVYVEAVLEKAAGRRA